MQGLHTAGALLLWPGEYFWPEGPFYELSAHFIVTIYDWFRDMLISVSLICNHLMPEKSHKNHAVGMFMSSLKCYVLAVVGKWEIVIW